MENGKHVILYVEDDKDFLDSMRAILESNDYKMVEATTAEEGLRIYKQNQPDLIIVDLMMEEVDAGANFVKELRAIGNTAPIFMLSSVGDDLTMSTDYNELGLAGVFQKPIDPDNLLNVLRTKLKAK
jgi:two-component system, chemotaxis family, chemotaxis protein CheY